MNPDSNNSSKKQPARLGRSLSRTAGYVLIGGLAAGGAFAAVTGISAADVTTSGTAIVAPAAVSTQSTTAPSTSPAAPFNRPGPGAREKTGGPAGFGHGGWGFGRAGGTVTAINGTTLTLRTEEGTETVKTTAATTFTKERETLKLSQLHVGDVVRAGVPRPAGTANPGTVTPGTGTVTAERIEVVLPVLTGRVTAVNSGGYTMTGPDGQYLTVTTTSATRYYSGSSTTTAATVKVGTHIVAEGAQDSLTKLTADVVTVAPAPGTGLGKHGPGR